MGETWKTFFRLQNYAAMEPPRINVQFTESGMEKDMEPKFMESNNSKSNPENMRGMNN